MLGDTLTITLGGSGGTAVVCNKINQDSYSAEYLFRNTSYEVRAKVRHSKESVKAGQPAVDRHNLEITQTVFSGDLSVPDTVRQAYIVLRNTPSDDSAAVQDVAEALAFRLDATTLGKIIGWES